MKMKDTYDSKRKDKLTQYKKLHITEDSGTYLRNRKSYAHILPNNEYKLNILKDIADPFWDYLDAVSIKKHRDFHHLNSSQALCFNLFFPLFNEDERFLAFVLLRMIEIDFAYSPSKEDLDFLYSETDKVLQNQIADKLDKNTIQANMVIDIEFEKILDKTEFTNFDFYVSIPNNHRVLFEIKYTESDFASAKLDASHLKKYKEIYEPKLKGIIKSEYLNEEFVLKNYQIARNLSYIDENTTVVFLYPEGNEKLSYAKSLIGKALTKEASKMVRIIYLEDFVEQIIGEDYLESLHGVYHDV